jgi:hypothetical protein
MADDEVHGNVMKLALESIKLANLRPSHSVQEAAFLAIVGMLVVGGFAAGDSVLLAGPGAEVDKLASFGAERTIFVVRRALGRFAAGWTAHRPAN